MKKQRKTPNTIESCVENAAKLEIFMANLGTTANECTLAELDRFIESEIDKKRVSRYMWTLQYYYSFLGNDSHLGHVGEVRESNTAKRRRDFEVKDFMGVKKSEAKKLNQQGIKSIHDMMRAARTKKMRKDLSMKTGIKLDRILEIAKLSNLAQISGVRSTRARLYHDAGIDSIQKVANLSGKELRKITSEFIARTNFDGIPPTPKEASNAVRHARKLKDKVEF